MTYNMRKMKEQIAGMWLFYEMAGEPPSITLSERNLRRFASEMNGAIKGANLRLPYTHLMLRFTPEGTLKVAHLPIYIPRGWTAELSQKFHKRSTQKNNKRELSHIRKKSKVAPLHEAGHIISNISNPHFLGYQYKIAPQGRTMDLTEDSFVGAIAETHAELLAYRFLGRETLEFKTDDLAELFYNANRARLDEPDLKRLMAKDPTELKEIIPLFEMSKHQQAPHILSVLKEIADEIKTEVFRVETYYF